MQSTVQSVLEQSTTHGKGLEVPCQNAFKDKPAFNKRLLRNKPFIPSSLYWTTSFLVLR